MYSTYVTTVSEAEWFGTTDALRPQADIDRLQSLGSVEVDSFSVNFSASRIKVDTFDTWDEAVADVRMFTDLPLPAELREDTWYPFSNEPPSSADEDGYIAVYVRIDKD